MNRSEKSLERESNQVVAMWFSLLPTLYLFAHLLAYNYRVDINNLNYQFQKQDTLYLDSNLIQKRYALFKNIKNIDVDLTGDGINDKILYTKNNFDVYIGKEEGIYYLRQGIVFNKPQFSFPNLTNEDKMIALSAININQDNLIDIVINTNMSTMNYLNKGGYFERRK